VLQGGFTMRKRRHFRRKGPPMFRMRRQRRGLPEGGRLNGDSINPLPEMWSDNILGHEDITLEVSEVLVYPPHLKTNRHHRVAQFYGARETVKSKKGKRYNNISLVPIQAHDAFNTLFGGHATAAQVCSILNRYWIDPRVKIRFFLVDDEE
jgi:hypothetical protein